MLQRLEGVFASLSPHLIASKRAAGCDVDLRDVQMRELLEEPPEE